MFWGPQTGTKRCSQTINVYNIYNIIFIIYFLFYFISLPVDFKICFKILVLRYRALNGQDPYYLYKLFTKQTCPRSIRSQAQNLLVVSCIRLKTRAIDSLWHQVSRFVLLLQLLIFLFILLCLVVQRFVIACL